MCGGGVFSSKVIGILDNDKHKYKFCGGEDQNYYLPQVQIFPHLHDIVTTNDSGYSKFEEENIFKEIYGKYRSISGAE